MGELPGARDDGMALARARAVKRILSSVVITALIAVLLACAFGPQGPQRQVILRNGPYKVVISKPLPAQGWPADSIYSEHGHLTEVFNQLEIDGLTPVFTNVITERADGRPSLDRLLVVCRRP